MITHTFVDKTGEKSSNEWFIYFLKFDTLKRDHNLIMKSISNLTKISVKIKPLQKISAYKSLTATYHKLKGNL